MATKEERIMVLKVGVFAGVLLPFSYLLWSNWITENLAPVLGMVIAIGSLLFFLFGGMIGKNKEVKLTHEEKMQKLNEQMKEQELQLQLEQKKAELEKKKAEIKELNKSSSSMPNVLKNISGLCGKTDVDLEKIKKLM